MKKGDNLAQMQHMAHGTFSYENVICLENIQLKRQYNNETKAEKMTYVYKVQQLF